MGGRKLTKLEIEKKYKDALEKANNGQLSIIACGCVLILAVNAPLKTQRQELCIKPGLKMEVLSR